MADRLSDLVISFQKRNARARGPTSSEAWNDQADELVRDLSAIQDEWNTFLVPLLQNMPDGTNDLNAFTTGLDGKTLLVNVDAGETTSYFNTTKSRPNSVYEQFQELYSYVDAQVTAIQTQVNSVALSADDIPIEDSAGLFAGANIESALAEIMTLVLSTGGVEHGNLIGLGDDDHTQYLPRTGSRAMTGDFSMGGFNIGSVVNITGPNNLYSSGQIDNFRQVSAKRITTHFAADSGGGGGKYRGLFFDEVVDWLRTDTGNGFSGSICSLGYARPHKIQTTDATITGDHSGGVYTNANATAAAIITLPAAASQLGVFYTFICNDTDQISIKAVNNEQIRISTSQISSSNGTTRSTTIGSTITLVSTRQAGAGGAMWMAVMLTGSWSVT